MSTVFTSVYYERFKFGNHCFSQIRAQWVARYNQNNKKKTIKYCFDDSGACCNQYNVVESFPLADLVGQELLEMDLFETNELVKLAKKRKEDNHRGGQGIFVIRCSSLVYKLQMYNYHNGWYSMNFDVFENGKRKWNLAF